jgi:hypothetical protein
MSFNEARDRTFAWAASMARTEEPPQQVRDVWNNVEPGIPARAINDLVIRSFSVLDEPARQLVATLDLRNPPVAAPDLSQIERSSDDFYRSNVLLSVARFLTEARLYDEAHSLYADADLAAAVDPATALFFKAVCEHQLLMKKEGLHTLDELDRAEAVPESYAAVARLMRSELEALEDDSLDEIAALMRDVGRRLELARGGQRVQKREDEITSKLDEMIKKAEEQMNKSSRSSSGNSSGGSNQPNNNPLGESVVKGSTAPGEVDPKDMRREGGWGDLPRREREQAKNEMERAFPSNYGRLINEYFLKRTRGEQPATE